MYKELPIFLEMNNSKELLIGHIAVSVTNKLGFWVSSCVTNNIILSHSPKVAFSK